MAAIVLGAVAASSLAGLAAFLWWSTRPPPPMAASDGAATGASRDRTPTLYCEFNNFADLTPLVGFYFRRDGDRQSPAYALIYRREQDGSRTDAGGPDLSARPWTFAGSDDSASLGSPDDDTAINLYGYQAGGTGTGWFEAGLRSIRYKNLGGRCRHDA